MPAETDVRWPDHWYHDQDHVHCIAPNCDFTTLLKFLRDQWHELNEHCKSELSKDHAILRKMLQQSYCAFENCDQLAVSGNASRKARALFAHEKLAHGTTHMSNICSFVRLAREGRIVNGTQRTPDPECERFAYFRMLEKIQALPQTTIEMIFRKNGYLRSDQQTFENMGRIFTYDHLRQPGDKPPFWWPIRTEDFLRRCAPHPEAWDDDWRAIWEYLRASYADGRI